MECSKCHVVDIRHTEGVRDWGTGLLCIYCYARDSGWMNEDAGKLAAMYHCLAAGNAWIDD